MLAAAFASRYLWDSIGVEEQRAVGDWQIEHVASVLGHADLALRWAERALERAIQNGWTDWRLASCYEGWLGPTRPPATGGNGTIGWCWFAPSSTALTTPTTGS